MRVIGLDPGLRNTGWGVIEADGNRLRHVANGVVRPPHDTDLATRLMVLKAGLEKVLATYKPDAAAVEVTLANRNPDSTLKLGMARGMALLVPAEAGLVVAEYLPMIVKKSVVGTGHAAKEQVQAMIAQLLPGVKISAADAADALAVAICHAHNLQTSAQWSKGHSDPLRKTGIARMGS